VPANRSPLTGKPTRAGKPTAVGKATPTARQPGNRASKHKTEPTPAAVSTSAPRNAAIRSRTERTIKQTPERQTLQTPPGLPKEGLRNWNFVTKRGSGLTLTPAAVSTKPSFENTARFSVVASRTVPQRAVTLAQGTVFTLRSLSPPGLTGQKKFAFSLSPPGLTGNSGGVPRSKNLAGLASNNTQGSDRGQGARNPTNQRTTESTGTMLSYEADAGNGPGTEPTTPQVMSGRTPLNSANAGNEKATDRIAPAEHFQQNRRIQGSDQWVESDYDVFRDYRSEWHDRDWWRTHQSRIIFGAGGWYYWTTGYWFPAWGYDPDVNYAYDGPIYAYSDLPPDQVITKVQGTLRQQGYYQGESDGLLAPPTTAALVDYQQAHGLYETSTIDRPTSQSLGMK
jgi:Putative peptidoglycan binding domain